MRIGVDLVVDLEDFKLGFGVQRIVKIQWQFFLLRTLRFVCIINIMTSSDF